MCRFAVFGSLEQDFVIAALDIRLSDADTILFTFVSWSLSTTISSLLAHHGYSLLTFILEFCLAPIVNFRASVCLLLTMIRSLPTSLMRMNTCKTEELKSG